MHGSEIQRLAKELEQGQSFRLEPLPSRQPPLPDVWWDMLKTDPATQTDPSSRPR